MEIWSKQDNGGSSLRDEDSIMRAELDLKRMGSRVIVIKVMHCSV